MYVYYFEWEKKKKWKRRKKDEWQCLWWRVIIELTILVNSQKTSSSGQRTSSGGVWGVSRRSRLAEPRWKIGKKTDGPQQEDWNDSIRWETYLGFIKIYRLCNVQLLLPSIYYIFFPIIMCSVNYMHIPHQSLPSTYYKRKQLFHCFIISNFKQFLFWSEVMRTIYCYQPTWVWSLPLNYLGLVSIIEQAMHPWDVLSRVQIRMRCAWSDIISHTILESMT